QLNSIFHAEYFSDQTWQRLVEQGRDGRTLRLFLVLPLPQHTAEVAQEHGELGIPFLRTVWSRERIPPRDAQHAMSVLESTQPDERATLEHPPAPHAGRLRVDLLVEQRPQPHQP